MRGDLVVTSELGASYQLPDVSRAAALFVVTQSMPTGDSVIFTNLHQDVMIVRGRVIAKIEHVTLEERRTLWEKNYRTV